MKIRQLFVLELSTGLIRVAENFTGRMSRKSPKKPPKASETTEKIKFPLRHPTRKTNYRAAPN